MGSLRMLPTIFAETAHFVAKVELQTQISRNLDFKTNIIADNYHVPRVLEGLRYDQVSNRCEKTILLSTNSFLQSSQSVAIIPRSNKSN